MAEEIRGHRAPPAMGLSQACRPGGGHQQGPEAADRDPLSTSCPSHLPRCHDRRFVWTSTTRASYCSPMMVGVAPHAGTARTGWLSPLPRPRPMATSTKAQLDELKDGIGGRGRALRRHRGDARRKQGPMSGITIGFCAKARELRGIKTRCKCGRAPVSKRQTA